MHPRPSRALASTSSSNTPSVSVLLLPRPSPRAPEIIFLAHRPCLSSSTCFSNSNLYCLPSLRFHEADERIYSVHFKVLEAVKGISDGFELRRASSNFILIKDSFGFTRQGMERGPSTVLSTAQLEVGLAPHLHTLSATHPQKSIPSNPNTMVMMAGCNPGSKNFSLRTSSLPK